LNTGKRKELIIISKSYFCYVPELYKKQSQLNILNTFPEQLRKELNTKTELGVIARVALDRKMTLTKEIEFKLWQNILQQTEKSKLNILNLNSFIRIELLFEAINSIRSCLNTKAINLELDINEFERRAKGTIAKIEESNGVQNNSLLTKYKNLEFDRKNVILKVEQNMEMKFKYYDAVNNEKSLISNIVSNSL